MLDLIWFSTQSSRLLPIDEPSAKANHQAEEKLRAELAEAVARCEWEAAQRGAAERQLTAFQRLLSKANEDLRVARQEKGGRGGAPEVQGTPQDEEGDAKAAAVAALQWLRSGWEAEEKAGTPSWAEAEVSLMRVSPPSEGPGVRHALLLGGGEDRMVGDEMREEGGGGRR